VQVERNDAERGDETEQGQDRMPLLEGRNISIPKTVPSEDASRGRSW